MPTSRRAILVRVPRALAAAFDALHRRVAPSATARLSRNELLGRLLALGMLRYENLAPEARAALLDAAAGSVAETE